MVELEIKPTAGMRTGVIALLALAAGIGAVLIFLLTGGGREFFERTTTLTTWMPDGTGVAPGSEVRLSGIAIGHVTSADISGLLDPQRVVRVDMQVNARYLRSIPSDSETTIGADTLVGFKFIDIQEGKSPIPVHEAGELRSEPVKQAADRADLVLSLQKELDQVDNILERLSSPDTSLGHFLLDEDEYDKLLSRVTSFDASIKAAVGSKSPIGQILYSDAMYKSLRDKVAAFDAMLASIQQGKGSAGKFFADDEQYNAMVAQVKSVRSSLAAIAPKLQGQAGYDKFVTLLRNTDRTILALTVGDSTSARLLENAKLYESLYGSLHGMETLLSDFRQNPQKYMRYQVFNKKKKK